MTSVSTITILGYTGCEYTGASQTDGNHIFHTVQTVISKLISCYSNIYVRMYYHLYRLRS